jgi:N4-gp56 family major capsid protein
MPITPQTYGLTPQRIGKYKGEILAHAVPVECLSRQGRHIELPKNQSDTYVARRFLPFGSTATNSTTQNTFFPTATGDRGNVIVQAHLVTEGVTPLPESIVPMDVQVVIMQYSCLYGFTDKTYDLYEDDIPKQMIKQVGERVTLVNELIVWGVLRGCTNQFYGGTGTTMLTVNGPLTLGLIRKIVKSLQANHSKPVNSMLKASGDYGTSAVSIGYSVYTHTDMEPDIRDIPGYTPVEKYASGKPMEYEIGMVERFRFFTSPDLPAFQDAGAAIGATGLQSTTGVTIDVYPFVVVAQDAWSQLAVRGVSALDPTYLAPGLKQKSDPHGQRGYAGTIWWKAALVENNGWMAVGNVGIKTLP